MSCEKLGKRIHAWEATSAKALGEEHVWGIKKRKKGKEL